MWSVGCIFAELLGGKPLFPGTSTLNQVNKVLEVTGKPSKEDIIAIQSELAQTMLESIPAVKTKSLKSLYHGASSTEIDFLSKLLQFNPNKRLNVDQALEHSYVAEFHELYKETEITSNKQIKIPIDDNIKYSVKEYRQRLYDDILRRKKEIRKKLLQMQKKGGK